MAVNFPNNPQVGETYTLGSRTWQWSGTFWRAVSTTVGYTGSQGGGFNFLGTVATEQDLPLPYSGEESDAYVVAATGILWIWDGSSWGPVGQFTGYTGSRGTPGASVRIVGSVADQSLLPTPYGGNIGDGYLLADTGHLWTWDGTAWNDIGKLAGDVGATGFTGSIGFTGSTGYTGSVGESTFTWGDTAPENPAIGDRWFDTVVGAVTVYVDDGDSQAWLEVAGSGFMGQTGYTGSGSGSGPKVSGIDYPGDATAADPAGGETLGIQGSGFESGAHVLLDNQAVGQVVFVSATRLEFVAPSKTEGTYAYLYVINPDGGVAIHVPGVQYSGAPSWSTPAAGNLGSVYETQSINQSFAAVSDSSVTYSLASGTLPAGSTLDPATGVLSGTAGLIDNATTYTFIIRATDAESQTADRQFSLTIDPDTMTWSFPSEGAVIEIPQDEASTTTFSASAATGNAVTYSVSALPDGLALSGDTVSGTATTLGDTAATATASSTAAAASVSLTWRVVLGGDLYFNQTTLLLNADNNTFITDASDNAFTITPVADTRPSAFSPYNTAWRNYFDGTGDYLTLADNTAFTLTSDFTIECFFFTPVLPTSTQTIAAKWAGSAQEFIIDYWIKSKNEISTIDEITFKILVNISKNIYDLVLIEKILNYLQTIENKNKYVAQGCAKIKQHK